MIKDAQKILVAVDDSKQAYQAFKKAVQVAKAMQVNIYLVSVLDEALFNPKTRDSIIDDQLIQERKQLLQDYKLEAEEEDHFTDVTTEVLVADPKRQIVHFIKENPAYQLVVVGATGKNATERLFIGSVSQYIVRHSPVSVMLVR